MEEQWDFNASSGRALHLETLPGQDYPNLACYLGRLDSADGDHLFVAARPAVSALRPCAFVLGSAFDLHDESFLRENRSGRAVGAFCRDRRLNRGLRGFKRIRFQKSVLSAVKIL